MTFVDQSLDDRVAAIKAALAEFPSRVWMDATDRSRVRASIEVLGGTYEVSVRVQPGLPIVTATFSDIFPMPKLGASVPQILNELNCASLGKFVSAANELKYGLDIIMPEPDARPVLLALAAAVSTLRRAVPALSRVADEGVTLTEAFGAWVS